MASVYLQEVCPVTVGGIRWDNINNKWKGLQYRNHPNQGAEWEGVLAGSVGNHLKILASSLCSCHLSPREQLPPKNCQIPGSLPKPSGHHPKYFCPLTAPPVAALCYVASLAGDPDAAP